MKPYPRVLILLAIAGLLCVGVPAHAERSTSFHAPTEHQLAPPPPGWPKDAQSTTGPVPPPEAMRTPLSPSASSTQVVLNDVPDYMWYRGCGPTAAGMIIGYWDGKGFDSLVSGSAATQTVAVNAMISSDGNYDDYYLPDDTYTALQPDRSELPVGDEHPDDSVADFMKTSQSHYYNRAGWSWWSHVPGALTNYVHMIAPQYGATAVNQDWGTFTWEEFKAEINAGRPVVLLVDSDADGFTDHFVAGIGYSDDGVNRQYAAQNTWYPGVHWYPFVPMQPDVPWGVYGATFFQIKRLTPGDFGKLSPSNAAWGQGSNVTLSWGSSTDATSYEYCFDTTNNNACDGSWASTTSTSAKLTGLTTGRIYYWQVRANNSAGSTYANGGAWWLWTTAPFPPLFMPMVAK